MNWEAVGAIAELLGATGVIASLAYLAIQIRQNTRQMSDHGRALRLSALGATADAFSGFRDPLIRDPELVSLFLRGSEAYSQLSREEKLRLSFVLQELFFLFQNTRARVQEGTMQPSAWTNQQPTLLGLLRSSGIADWWTRSAPLFAPDFVEEVNRLRGGGGGADPEVPASARPGARSEPQANEESH